MYHFEYLHIVIYSNICKSCVKRSWEFGFKLHGKKSNFLVYDSIANSTGTNSVRVFTLLKSNPCKCYVPQALWTLTARRVTQISVT